MADTDGTQNGHNAGAMDIAAHRESFDRFMGWLKIGTLASAIVTAVVVVIIAS